MKIVMLQTSVAPEALYLGMCIERKLGDAHRSGVRISQLRNRYPNRRKPRRSPRGSASDRAGTISPNVGPATEPARPSAGALLRIAREAAGLSLDQVAQQLKLAPRQVKALEDESFGELPGRTFSRGFVRNYARLLHLDADAVLASLPGASAPSLDSPALHQTRAHHRRAANRGERGRSGWTRWAFR